MSALLDAEQLLVIAQEHLFPCEEAATLWTNRVVMGSPEYVENIYIGNDYLNLGVS